MNETLSTGNRQSETRNAGTMSYAYSPPNWLYQAGSDTRTRTAYGNTASPSTASFTYDGFNRLATSQTAVTNGVRHDYSCYTSSLSSSRA